MSDTPREPETLGDQPTPAGDDYGGLDRNLDQVDRGAAQEIGSDPPGGGGTDIGGGSGEMTADDLPTSGGTLEA